MAEVSSVSAGIGDSHVLVTFAVLMIESIGRVSFMLSFPVSYWIRQRRWKCQQHPRVLVFCLYYWHSRFSCWSRSTDSVSRCVSSLLLNLPETSEVSTASAGIIVPVKMSRALGACFQTLKDIHRVIADRVQRNWHPYRTLELVTLESVQVSIVSVGIDKRCDHKRCNQNKLTTR